MEGKVMNYFARHPGATQSDLVAHSGRDKGQVARLLAGMKDKGLLDASTDEKDRRVVRHFLTEKAKNLHSDVKRQRQQLSRLAVSGFSADQKQQLLELLRQVQMNLRN
jgi:DNA-binding MarR family transcriptional regulator